MTLRNGVVALALVVLMHGSAGAQTQIKGRVMVMVDTSGSMVWRFNDNDGCHDKAPGPCGDGDLLSRYTDSLVAGQNFYPGRMVNNVALGSTSRLYAAKHALTDVINSAGDLDFGLMRYVVNPLCPNNTNCCNFTGGAPGTNQACICSPDYVDYGVTDPASQCFGGVGKMGDGRITYSGGCGMKDANGNAINGGQILVQPTQQNNNAAVLQWVDGVEDFRPGGINGFPLNPELHSAGETPLAGVVRSAIANWYTPIYTDTRNNPNCDPQNDPNCDPQIDCRPYVFVVMTDGADSCEGCKQASCPVFNQAQATNPPAAVAQLHGINANNPVLTYVIGLAFINQDPAIGVLNAMAKSGGTDHARFANSQADIEAAFADIASASVKYEICNNKDDNCNGLTDEGFDKGAACLVGIGGCQRAGIKKCTQDGSGTRCCVDDGKPSGACVPLLPGAIGPLICQGNADNNCNGVIDQAEPGCQQGGCKPTPEVCNGLDDDCDGIVDDNLVDTNKPCGLDIGQCKPGVTACTPNNGLPFPDASDHLICQGEVGPKVEVCNGLDDDCDGITDGMTRVCYDGDPKTDNIGLCHDGQQKCVVGNWGQCVGEQLPAMEICNGLDDNCNGKVDDVIGFGVSCCPSMKCGVGVCAAGVVQCSGETLQCLGGQGPTPEVCNGLDDDCNGVVDDVPNLGKACLSGGGCSGVLACDVQKMAVTCQANGQKMLEICDGIDNDCDGVADEPADVAKNDPRVGVSCGNPKSLPLPCRAGKTVCKMGNVVCDGAVGPAFEVCDGIDNDCDGVIDNNAICPMNYACFQGKCDPVCQQNEFPCPGGFSELTVNMKCLCVPDKSCAPACIEPLVCDAASGTCMDRCQGKTCSIGLQCDKATGECLGCETFGCKAACTRCDTSLHTCVDDKCCNVTCDPRKFCDPANGACRGTCDSPCKAGETCGSDGACVHDLCYMVQCPEGQACVQQTGMCAINGCANKSCGPHLACCGPDSSCLADPCEPVHCPTGTACHFDALSCQVRCDFIPVPPRDQIVGAGGGFGCSFGGRPSSSGGLGLLIGVSWLLSRRRRGRAVP